ncbi:MAG: hypothetical protein QOD99_2765 [Chthoniobacter sp.]|jgi:hypothetical protein|nr:hypothetical protein [Chthoniobacter sp.]
MRLRVFLPLLAFLFLAMAKKQPPVTVHFHVEANAQDTASFATPVTMQNPPRQAFVEKIPFLTERDIASVFPFAAEDGTMGCAFKLTEHGKFDLDAVSTDKRGKSIVAIVDGRQLVDMQIDKRVTDGIITVQRGLTPQEIALLEKKYPVLGQTKKKR